MAKKTSVVGEGEKTASFIASVKANLEVIWIASDKPVYAQRVKCTAKTNKFYVPSLEKAKRLHPSALT